MTYRRYRARRGRRAAAVLALSLTALVAATVAAPAGEGPRPTVVPRGVEIAGVPVGGHTAAEAEALVEASFARPLVVRYGGRAWQRTPAELGAQAGVSDAVHAALAARPRTTVPLAVSLDRSGVRRWVGDLAQSLDRRKRESTISLRDARPHVTRSRVGLSVRRSAAVRRIAQALELHARGPLELPVRRLEPERTRANVGPIVVVRRESHRLALYEGARLVRTFGVATGQPSYPTPLGSFEIVSKQRDPWWYPPASGWAEGLEPVPPGPGNPLGTRWLGLDVYAVGIHGTPDAASIGYSASHGCVRMHVADAEWLFERVEVGTPVFIVAA